MTLSELLSPPDHEIRADAFMQSLTQQLHDSFPDVNPNILKMMDHPFFRQLDQHVESFKRMGIDIKDVERQLHKMEIESAFLTKVSIFLLSEKFSSLDGAFMMATNLGIKHGGVIEQVPNIFRIPADQFIKHIDIYAGQTYIIFS